MHRSLLFLSASLVVLVAIGCGGAKTYDLAIRVKPGDKFNYTVVMTGDSAGEPVNITMGVDKVQNDVATFRIKIDTGSLPGGDDPTLKAMLEKISIIQDIGKRGKVVGKIRMEGMPTGFEDVADSMPDFATFPDHPVRVGDTWTGTTKVGSKDVRATFKLKEIEDLGGRKIAVLEMPPFEDPELKMDGPTISKVDLITGMPYEIKMSGMQGKEKFGMSITERR